MEMNDKERGTRNEGGERENCIQNRGGKGGG